LGTTEPGELTVGALQMVRFTGDGSLKGKVLQLLARKYSPKSGWWIEVRAPDTSETWDLQEAGHPYELVEPEAVAS
jgi:hypothetical protein